MSISAAPVANLQKAGRIVRGESVDDVLPPQSAPKTNSFAHNIHDPSDPRYVTIDGRAHDTLANRAIPWEAERGIGSAATKTGKTTRYEHAADLVRQVSKHFGIDPSAAQAIAWEGVKQDGEKRGGARKQGPTRLGQPIFHPQTGEMVIHDLSPVRHLQYGQFKG